MSLTLEDRIAGCLCGAVIGAELGLARYVQPKPFEKANEKTVFGIRMNRLPASWKPRPHRTDVVSPAPLVGLGVRAYLKAGGRATPEIFARLFRDDPGVSEPAFMWDPLHSIQEVLKEGMHPRISGMGATPTGLMCAMMPAVGIYHFADPQYAYLDGVELASVGQGRLGADWAGLTAAAIAAALAPGATGESVAGAVMDLAFQHNRELFYQLNESRHCRSPQGTARWYFHGAHSLYGQHAGGWFCPNPIRFVLPGLRFHGAQPEKLLALVAGSGGGWYGAMIATLVAGAIAGALAGPKAFPPRWRKWAEPVARPWLGISRVLRKRVAIETKIVRDVEAMNQPAADGQTVLLQKIRGCLLAGAIGNAMGSPVEGQLYPEIDKKHPGGIKTILEPWRLESEDDNQLAMLLVETYLGREGAPVMARQFGEMWKQRFNRDHFFPGCMGNAYDLIARQGWDARITGHWMQVTGSTVMCMEPVGIYHMADPEYAAIDALAVSYMYQRGLDALAASMMAATVAEAFRPAATVQSVCQAALSAAPDEPFRTFDRRNFRSPRHYIATCLDVAGRHSNVLRARKDLYDRCLLYHQIDPLELWGLSLAMFQIAEGDVRQAAIGGTNIGRDSDTIAGRAAMLSGTLRGAGNVPPEWVAMFSPVSLDRINRNAQKLADLATGPRLQRLATRAAAWEPNQASK